MKKTIIYLLICFGLTWGICLGLYLSGAWMITTTMAAGLAACMFCPTLGVIGVKLLTRESWSDLGLRPRLKGHIRHYLLAWWGPLIATLLGAGLWFLMNPEKFSANTPSLQATGLPLLLLTLIFAPFVNIIPAAGEELGWRGWLLPHLMEKHGVNRAILLSGLIWGLWHGPAIALGHNYGLDYPGYPWAGIAMFCLICIGMGAFLSWLRLRTGSFWPAALAHGFFNGVASIGIVFLDPAASYSPFAGPLPVGIVGGCFMLLVGAWCWLSISRQQP